MTGETTETEETEFELNTDAAVMVEKLVIQVTEHWQRSQASRRHDPSPAINAGVEDIVNDWRTNGISERTGLLVGTRNGKEHRYDLHTDEGLSTLEAAVDSALERAVESNTVDRKTDAGLLESAALITALTAAQSAMFSSNWVGIRTVLEWVHSSESQHDRHLVLKIYEAYVAFGKARHSTASKHSITKPPSLQHLRSLFDETQVFIRTNTADTDNQGLRMLLKLVESVRLMPAAWLQNERSEDQNGELTESGADYARLAISHCDEHTSSRLEPDQIGARINIALSDVYYALNDLDRARACAMNALQVTDGTDLPFIDRCQDRLDFLELEQASREANIATIMGSAVESAKERIKETAEELQSETRAEIKDALLRVVEVLGVFLGIAGIAVTSVGGIAAGRNALETLIIFGVGYASIVSFVVVLRWIVNAKPRTRAFTQESSNGDD